MIHLITTTLSCIFIVSQCDTGGAQVDPKVKRNNDLHELWVRHEERRNADSANWTESLSIEEARKAIRPVEPEPPTIGPSAFEAEGTTAIEMFIEQTTKACKEHGEPLPQVVKNYRPGDTVLYVDSRPKPNQLELF